MARSAATVSFHRLAIPLLVPTLVASWPALTSSRAAAAEFAVADIFFELNATAGDLGVQASVDAERWKELRIEGPGGQPLIDVSPRGNLRTIGLSELFFEGDEPSLREVPFSQFLKRVPAGAYRFVGTTPDNKPLRSTDRLTTELPCPVTIVSPPPDQEVGANAVVVRWRPAPGAYDPDRQRCDSRRDIGLVGYQVIVEVISERRNLTRSLLVDLPLSVTALPVPAAFLEQGARLPDAAYNIEVHAIEDSGNRTFAEQPFRVAQSTRSASAAVGE